MAKMGDTLNKAGRGSRAQPQLHGGVRGGTGADSAALTQMPELTGREHVVALMQLRRYASTTLFLERTFYENAAEIAYRIQELVPKCKPEHVLWLVNDLRRNVGLRSVSVFVAVQAAKSFNGRTVGDIVKTACFRPDDVTEFLAMYFGHGDRKESGQTLSHQAKRGLQRALQQFNSYQLAKYSGGNRGKQPWTLKDAVRLVHPRPATAQHAAAFSGLLEGTLSTPDTWEVNISRLSKDNTEARAKEWMRLGDGEALGQLALLRNLRNMLQDGVPRGWLREKLEAQNWRRILPFQFIVAMKTAPQLEPVLEKAMLKSLKSMRADLYLPGRTLLMLDNSYSMHAPLAGRSVLGRRDAAAALAIFMREVCEDVDIYAFAWEETPLPPRRGMALAEAYTSSPGGGTALGQSTASALRACGGSVDRVVILTDEQANGLDEERHLSRVAGAVQRGYIINVAPYKNGLQMNKNWLRISGFSDQCVKAICEYENSDSRVAEFFSDKED